MTMKKQYMTPSVEMMDLAVNGSVCLMSASSNDIGLKDGGSADLYEILEAEANENDGWDIW